MPLFCPVQPTLNSEVKTTASSPTGSDPAVSESCRSEKS